MLGGPSISLAMAAEPQTWLGPLGFFVLGLVIFYLLGMFLVFVRRGDCAKYLLKYIFNST